MGLFDFLGGGNAQKGNSGERDAAFASVDDQRSKLFDQATEARRRKPQQIYKAMDVFGENQKRGLASQMAQIDQGASGRGLLYSGLRDGAQANANSQYASEMANKRVQVNTEAEDQVMKMEDSAAQAGFAQQKAQDDAAKSAYDQAVLKRQGDLQTKGQILGLAGRGAGMAAGGG